ILFTPIIRGWANYHSHICAKSTFYFVDHRIEDFAKYFSENTNKDENCRIMLG
ncbi:MAG: hypothetical protein HQK89_15650, partial [Nitrospirae bacterium]|nr:hypothetical protein [Nitrospirota bacterium]